MTDEIFPVLPQGWQRSQVEALLIEIAPALQLGAKRLAALLYMMGRTRPADWTSRAHEPVYYAAQTDTALALGKTERALRNDERALDTVHGLIEKRVKANGSRSAHGLCGIVFSRLIRLVPDLIALRDHMRAERARKRDLSHRRSTYVRHMARAIAAASPALAGSDAFRAVTEAVQGWPPNARLRHMPLADLEAHLAACRALCATIDDLVETCDESSGRAAANFRSLIQENIQDIRSVDCTAPEGAADCREKKCEAATEARKCTFLERLTPERLYALAGPDMRDAIDRHRGDRAHVRELDLIEAAHDLLPLLGINFSAWAEAAQAMGPEGAALSVLILDANRTSPVAPVINPGGALRAMTRRYRAGRLNLTGSLIGLARRRGL